MKEFLKVKNSPLGFIALKINRELEENYKKEK